MSNKVKEVICELESILDEDKKLVKEINEFVKEKGFIRSFKEDLIPFAKRNKEIRNKFNELQYKVDKLNKKEFKIFFDEIIKICDKKRYSVKLTKVSKIEIKKFDLIDDIGRFFFCSITVIGCMFIISIQKTEFVLFLDICCLLLMVCYVRLMLISLINIFNVVKNKF